MSFAELMLNCCYVFCCDDVELFHFRYNSIIIDVENAFLKHYYAACSTICFQAALCYRHFFRI